MHEDIWCWWFDGAEDEYHGPFKSKQETMDDAYDHAANGSHIRVSEARYLTPQEYVEIEVDDLLDHASESAQDNEEVYHDRTIFKIRKDEEARAEDELASFLKAWAKKYVVTEAFVPTGQCELIVL